MEPVVYPNDYIQKCYVSLTKHTIERCADCEYVTRAQALHRFNDIFCVIETALLDVGNFSYLHANRVKLTLNNEENPVADYIASQAPHQECFGSFWRIAQQASRIIIDLTRDSDLGDKDIYYPLGIFMGHVPGKESVGTGKKVMDEMVVTHLKEATLEHGIALHQYGVTNKLTQQQSVMYRIHFKNWVDREGVKNVKVLGYLQALEAKVASLYDERRPSIVHCRAGAGRSGTFIVTAALTAMVEKKLPFPVNQKMMGKQINEFILQGRCQRNQAFVQNLDQYSTIWRFAGNIVHNNWMPLSEGVDIDLDVLS